jgi:hypothetical protein
LGRQFDGFRAMYFRMLINAVSLRIMWSWKRGCQAKSRGPLARILFVHTDLGCPTMEPREPGVSRDAGKMSWRDVPAGFGGDPPRLMTIIACR